MKKLLLIIIAILLWVSPLWATTYYFSVSGDDTQTCQVWSSPCKTIEMANSKANSLTDNDSILFKEGDIWDTAAEFESTEVVETTTYLDIDSGGSSGNEVIIGAYNGTTGEYVSEQSASLPKIVIQSNSNREAGIDAQYVIFENLELQEGNDGIVVGASNVTVRYCTAGWGAIGASADGVQVWGNYDDVVIRNNTFIFDIATDGSNGNNGVNIGAGADRTIIEYNHVEDWPHTNIKTAGGVSDTEIRNNKVVGDGCTSEDCRGIGLAFDDGNASGIIVEDNWFKDFSCQSQILGGSTAYTLSSVIIRRNLFDNMHTCDADDDSTNGFSINPKNGTVSGLNFSNNDLYNVCEHGIRIWRLSGDTGNITGSTFQDNIINEWNNVGSGHYAIYVQNVAGGSTWNKNIAYDAGNTTEVSIRGSTYSIDADWFTPTAESGQTFDDSDADPSFTNAANSDFTIAANGSANGNGYATGSRFDSGTSLPPTDVSLMTDDSIGAFGYEDAPPGASGNVGLYNIKGGAL